MPRERRKIPWLSVRDEVYYVYWYDAEGGRTKRLSLGTSDVVEAQARYAEFLTRGVGAFTGGPGGLTVHQALDDYFREHVSRNCVDVGRQEIAIRHLKAFFKGPLADIDIPMSRAYADARRLGVVGGGTRTRSGEGSDSTIRRELGVLESAANHAARWKRIGPKASPPTPMPSIEKPADAPAQDATYLTQAELATALAAAEGQLLDFMVVAYRTAGRRRSIERLTHSQVDLRQSRINLTAPDETANQRRSKKRRPVVPIDPQLRPTIERLMIENKASPWLFGNDKSMYLEFRAHMEKLGLHDKAHPHVLRHTRATHLLQAGVSIYDVARLLGDTVATVEKVYGHHSPDYLARAISK